MRTREELLKLADEHIGYAKNVESSLDDVDTRDERAQTAAPWIVAHTSIAQACVALAKEMREGGQPAQPLKNW